MTRKFKSLVVMILLVQIATVPVAAESKQLAEYVDPFIGTAAGLGNTFPGACVPFGMVQFSPDTTIHNCSGYDSAHRTIKGFTFTHLSGTGCNDYGNILFMPTVGEIKIMPGSEENPDEGYRSRFDKQAEKASPGYYSVVLKDYAVKTELTATKRAGFFRFTFPETNSAHILIDLYHRIGGEAIDGYVKIVDSHTIEGYSYCNAAGGGWCGGSDYTVYFAAKFSKPFNTSGPWQVYEPVDIPEDALVPPDTEEDECGLKGEYFNNRELSGKPALVRVDPQIGFDWGEESPGTGVQSDNFSVRWTGELVPPVSGIYQLGVTSDDGVRLFLDGELLIDSWVDRSRTRDTVTVNLEAEQAYDIQIEYYDHWVDAVAHLEWALPDAQSDLKIGSDEESGKHIGAVVNYTTSKNEVVLVKVGISFVSIAGARKNLAAEEPGRFVGRAV